MDSLSRPRFVLLGGLRKLLSAIETHGHNNARMATEACRAVLNVMAGSMENQAQWGEIGGVAATLALINRTQVEVKVGIEAVLVLSYAMWTSRENRNRFHARHGVTVLVNLLVRLHAHYILRICFFFAANWVLLCVENAPSGRSADSLYVYESHQGYSRYVCMHRRQSSFHVQS